MFASWQSSCVVITCRVRMPSTARVAVPNMTKQDMVKALREGIEFLERRVPRDSHIQALRDDLTGAMAETLYTLTLR